VPATLAAQSVTASYAKAETAWVSGTSENTWTDFFSAPTTYAAFSTRGTSNCAKTLPAFAISTAGSCIRTTYASSTCSTTAAYGTTLSTFNAPISTTSVAAATAGQFGQYCLSCTPAVTAATATPVPVASGPFTECNNPTVTTGVNTPAVDSATTSLYADQTAINTAFFTSTAAITISGCSVTPTGKGVNGGSSLALTNNVAAVQVSSSTFFTLSCDTTCGTTKLTSTFGICQNPTKAATQII